MDHSIPQTKHGISLSPINQKPFMQEMQKMDIKMHVKHDNKAQMSHGGTVDFCKGTSIFSPFVSLSHLLCAV